MALMLWVGLNLRSFDSAMWTSAKLPSSWMGSSVPIFDKERTIVDAFHLLSREMAIKALKMDLTQSSDQKLDLIKLQAYAKTLRVNIDPYLITATT
jgi:hypothetical protein